MGVARRRAGPPPDSTSRRLRAGGDGEPDGVQPQLAYVGYAITPEAWGNGYATAAVELLADYGFAERRLAKLWASVYETNPASARVLEKAGFEKEATHRQEAFVDGERVDVWYFGLLLDEWRSRRDSRGG